MELLPYLCAIISTYLATLSSLFLSEPEYKRPSAEPDFKQIRETVKLFLKSRELMKFVFALSAFVVLGNMLFVGFQPYLENIGLGKGEIGLVFVFISICSAIGSQLIKKLDKFGHGRTYKTMMLGALFTGSLMFAIRWEIGFLGVALLSLVFGFQNTFSLTYVNPRIDSSRRATGLSIISMLSTLGYTIAAILTGLILDWEGLGVGNGKWAGIGALKGINVLSLGVVVAIVVVIVSVNLIKFGQNSVRYGK